MEAGGREMMKRLVRCPSEQPRPLLLPEPLTLALDHECVALMQQPVQDRHRQDVVAEHRGSSSSSLISFSPEGLIENGFGNQEHYGLKGVRCLAHEELLVAQSSHRASALAGLVSSCRERFLQSARLLEIESPVIALLRERGDNEAAELGPLLPLWQVICNRYRTELYDPQITFFVDPATQVRDEWQGFFHYRLLPRLLESDEFLRNVLRAVGWLPCESSTGAADALRQHAAEMTLPSSTPVWALLEKQE